MHQLRTLTILAGAAMLLAACGDQGVDGDTLDAPGRAAPPALPDAASMPRTDLDRTFDQAAEELGVPAPLLKAIGFVETRWQMVEGEEEFEGMPPAYGIMALRGERLERGAALAGVPVEEARTDALANIRAAAALLREDADAVGIDRADLGAWAPIVAAGSGIEQPEAQASYIHDEVYRALREGVVVETEAGVLGSLLPAGAEIHSIAAPPVQAAGPDYAGSVWRPSPNYNSRPAGDIGEPGMIIIHTCEGSYAGCWGWLTNAASGVSAHYVVNESGSEISQLVHEANRAYHIGATYDCSLNSDVECWRNGYSSNHFTVGIEHGGYASQASWPLGQINASAALACDVTRDHGIPRDQYHIVAHGQLQPYNRVDPGPNWPWSDYINKIKASCGDTGGGVIIDSNNANNDTNSYYISVSSSWTASTNVAGYYGTGYYVASTQAISDGASFYFYLPSAAARTVSAWWTAAGDRSTSAPFVMFNASSANLGTVSVNQQINGGKWNTLGTFNFTAGWNRVVLSRWAPSGAVVIADAVRIH
ncbi:MAG: N-acetylmuramoyl-L-alanine amidase [Polyangiaceae bacterium]|nr:N-acetylmuramoyl-L-alanine amidase [Polyangiaceae bacterium]